MQSMGFMEGDRVPDKNDVCAHCQEYCPESLKKYCEKKKEAEEDKEYD